MSRKRDYDQLLKKSKRSENESEEMRDSRKPDLQALDAIMASLPNEMTILYDKKRE